MEAVSWIADGVTHREQRAADGLREMSIFDRESAATILSFPWVEGSELVDHELWAIDVMAQIFFSAREMIGDVLEFSWVEDGVTAEEGLALSWFLGLTRSDLTVAGHFLGSPFMEAPYLHRDSYALEAIYALKGFGDEADSPLFVKLTSQSWYEDGVDDGEAALLYAIRNIDHDTPLAEALIESHYVSSTWFTLPRTGNVGVGVVSTSPISPEDDTVEAMMEAVGVLEDFMQAPLPVNDVIVLFVEPEEWKYRGTIHQFGVVPAVALETHVLFHRSFTL